MAVAPCGTVFDSRTATAYAVVPGRVTGRPPPSQAVARPSRQPPPTRAGTTPECDAHPPDTGCTPFVRACAPTSLRGTRTPLPHPIHPPPHESHITAPTSTNTRSAYAS
ncbi:hypothetical protein JCM18897A_38990 [Streptomyces sp. JCM 18897]|uniref:Uncharacterized protein n=1 Tax=Streptomyces albidoflavus TaxID=1886 RepID=A0AA37BXT5_9ACTN|nr:hypothetical protein MTP02_21020 [Streptomyces albus]GHI46224.1 hypothetical protein ScoT_23980 [Streptomyces albidoflavus]